MLTIKYYRFKPEKNLFFLTNVVDGQRKTIIARGDISCPICLESSSMASIEQDVIDYYTRFWSKLEFWLAHDTLGIHLGYYEKGIKTHQQSMYHMNDFTWSQLHLDGTTLAQVLDVGCGVGGTSIYLAKKYPQVYFTGINITPVHIEMAKQFAMQRQVTANTQFLEKNFTDTQFPDNFFDGIFALESTNYASDITAYLKEMYRVLKPGRRFVILDGFLNGAPLNSFLQKIYTIWLRGRALRSLEDINDLKKTMLEQGFKDIQVVNINSHVARSSLRASIIGIPFFFSALLKIIFTLNHYKKEEAYDYFMGISFLSSLLALNKFTGYYTVIGTK